MRFTLSRIKQAVLLCLAAMLMNFYTAKAQTPDGIMRCGSDENWMAHAAQHPELYQQRQQMLNEVSHRRLLGKDNTKRIIPVVFHILHTYGPENISDANVQAQIKTLNLNYSKSNTDLSQVVTDFQSLIADCNVEFRLATKDPNGNCTNGIEHIYSALTNNAGESSKLNTWDHTKYLNIWVVASINSSGIPNGGTILGYAQFPWDNSPSTDGVIVRADQIVSGNTTLTHEIGHFLGLLHTFETAMGVECGNNCANTGDFICDTPPTAQANFGCNTSLNSCHSDVPDKPDMIQNYMDYSSCAHMFTLGQKSRMDQFFLSERANLISQSNLVATGTDQAPSSSIVYCTPKADFYANAYTICEGSSITFHDASSNSAVTNYNWTFNGGTPATSTSQAPVVTFSQPGTYTVELKASNPAGTGDVVKNQIITVLPNVADTKLPFSEDFETGTLQDGWNFTTDDNGVGWTETTKAGYSGRHSIYLNNFNGTAGTVYNATMPMIDLSGMKNPKLTFRYAYTTKSTSSNDLFRVQVNTGCGYGNFTNVFSKAAKLITTSTNRAIPFTPDTSMWKTISIDLTNYQQTTNAMFRFSVLNGSGNNFYIDNINISGESLTALGEMIQDNGQLQLYPNPASDNITVNIPQGLGNGAALQITDMSGKQLQSISNVGERQQLNLSREDMNISTAGIYFVKLISGNKLYSAKLVILNK
jgi:hypothetical protein